MASHKNTVHAKTAVFDATKASDLTCIARLGAAAAARKNAEDDMQRVERDVCAAAGRQRTQVDIAESRFVSNIETVIALLRERGFTVSRPARPANTLVIGWACATERMAGT